MRQITTCPACQTQFFVTDAILNHALGKVRCGDCAHVFIASQHLANALTPEIAKGIPTKSLITPPEISIDNHQTTPPNINDKTPRIGDYIPGRYQSTWLGKEASNPKKPSTAITWLMLVFCTLLVLTAIGQGVYRFRDTIATNYPATRHALSLFCGPLQCTIGLSKDIKRIIIISSDIRDNADVDGAMHFTATLQNTANFPQAYPNVELTLTNLKDEALLRRVLKPKDYLAKGTDINAEFLAGEVINIDLNILAKELVVSGYRVLIRY
jgi:predicted Zn finger-like uncharacterized protein